ncbi:post-transcriptional regulator [Gracilibacillus alcaliphilus]
MRKPVAAWRNEVTEILESKVEEFKMLDYSKVTSDDIWNCLKEKVWKGEPEKSLSELIQDIYHLPANLFITYLTQKTWTDSNLQESLDAILGKNST